MLLELIRKSNCLDSRELILVNLRITLIINSNLARVFIITSLQIKKITDIIQNELNQARIYFVLLRISFSYYFFELIGTNLMKLSDGFTKICFSVGTLISYALLLPLAFPSRNFFSFSRQWSQSIYSSL